ncbi:hypothetical protein B0H14DRAFT_3863547 [Mycena olivaceomarginata]|nr:hypothetical protein B0H14DRAFT_3863547 [Mycena olivaceomarginata]
MQPRRIEKSRRRVPMCGLDASVATDGTLYQGRFCGFTLARRPRHCAIALASVFGAQLVAAGTAHAHMKPETRVRGDRPTVLLLGIWLGLERVNPVYHETIKMLYTFPQPPPFLHNQSAYFADTGDPTLAQRWRPVPRFATSRPSAVIAALPAPRARLLPPQHPDTVCSSCVPPAIVRRCTSLRAVQCRSAVYLLILLAPFCSPLVDTVTFISASRVVF